MTLFDIESMQVTRASGVRTACGGTPDIPTISVSWLLHHGELFFELYHIMFRRVDVLVGHIYQLQPVVQEGCRARLPLLHHPQSTVHHRTPLRAVRHAHPGAQCEQAVPQGPQVLGVSRGDFRVDTAPTVALSRTAHDCETGVPV